MKALRACTLSMGLIALALTAPAAAERMQRFGDYEAHYSLVPTTLLNPRVAAGYGISRGRDRALLSISVLNAAGEPIRAEVTGVVKDLLGQERALELDEVVEGEAVYYLTEIRHGDREVLRFAIDIATPEGASHRLAFQQQMFWSDR